MRIKYKIKDKTQWHEWFAWFPVIAYIPGAVRTSKDKHHKIVWWETVYRQMIVLGDDYVYSLGCTPADGEAELTMGI